MTKTFLTRHGHVEGSDPVRFRGRIDLPLATLGEAQAAAVARRIAEKWRPKVVYKSPMSRCVTTGRHIASACQIDTEILDDLTDLDHELLWEATEWRTDDQNLLSASGTSRKRHLRRVTPAYASKADSAEPQRMHAEIERATIEKDGKTIRDHQGDEITEDELMKAAHNFVANSRTMGAMHKAYGDS